jgi:ankyrin repeat protein
MRFSNKLICFLTVPAISAFHYRPFSYTLKMPSTAFSQDGKERQLFQIESLPRQTKNPPYISNLLLHNTIMTGDLEAICQVIQDGADVNERDCYGVTPIGALIAFDDRVDILELLIEAGADINQLTCRPPTNRRA